MWTWTRRFGLTNASDATLRAVLAYMPRVANWAYRGNARRYFDFGAWSGVEFVGTEREFHHYGAPLNAIVALEAFRASPDETHLLDVGLAGATGTLTNIRFVFKHTYVLVHYKQSVFKRLGVCVCVCLSEI